MMLFRTVFGLAISSIAMNSAASNKTATSYDIDSDGNISKQEYKLFVLETLNINLGKLDKDNDGIILPKDISGNENIDKLKDEVQLRLIEFETENPSNSISVSEFSSVYGIKESSRTSKSFFEKTGILIRDTHDTLNYLGNVKPAVRAKPATLSFNRDVSGDTSTVAVQANVSKLFSIDKNRNISFLPSIDLIRSRNRPKTESETDTVILRAGFARYLPLNPTGTINDIYFNISPAFTTDSDFDRDVRSVEISLQPTSIQYGIGANFRLGFIDTVLTPTLRYEFGETKENDDGEEVDDRFSRLGVRVISEFYLKNKNESFASLVYEYLGKTSGDLRDRKYFEIGFSFPLDNNGNFTAELKYQNGDLSVALEDVETVHLGLGIRF